MSNYSNAGDGLRKMYVAAIGVIVCGLFMAMPLVGILAAIGIIVFFVVDLVGYYRAGKDITGCKVAFVLRILSILLSLINIFPIAIESAEITVICSLVGDLFPLASVGLVFLSVAKVLRENGAEELAKQGNQAWWIYLGCTVVTSVLDIVTVFSGLGATLLILVISLALSIVALIVQLKFYKNSAEQFGVYF